MELKTKEIELFNRKILISERTALDVNKLLAYSKNKIEKNYTEYIIEAVATAEDALKINYKNLPFYRFIKKRTLKKILSQKYLIKNLSGSAIFELARQVLELEGFIDKKKAAEESPLTSQTV